MAAFRDIEEVSQGLLSLLGANRAEAQQRRLLGRHEQVVERLLETQDGAEQQLRGESWSVGAGPRGTGPGCWERPNQADLNTPSFLDSSISCPIPSGTAASEPSGLYDSNHPPPPRGLVVNIGARRGWPLLSAP